MADGNSGRPKTRDVLGMTPEQEEIYRTDVGARLAAFRETMDMNQTEFYGNAGLPPNAGSHYERGYSLPSMQYALALCFKTGMSLDYLFNDRLSSLSKERAELVAKRLPLVKADLKDRLDCERRKNEREGRGYVSDQRLKNEKESQRTKNNYNAMKKARDSKSEAA